MSDINKMTVKFYDDSAATFTDLTENMYEMARDPQAIAIETADYLYLGREKPFNNVHIEFGGTVNAVASTLTAEYYDFTDEAWTALPILANETETGGDTTFGRSGRIKWDKGIDSDDWGEVVIDGITQYWVRFDVSSNITATTSFQGMGVVFTTDNDLKRFHPSIRKLLSRDEDDVVEGSFIRIHEAARDVVMLELNQGGIYKNDYNYGNVEPLDAWDVHDVNHVKLAATYAALSIVFFDNSDTEGDQYDVKSKHYRSEFKNAMQNVIIELDRDDDGIVGADEQGVTFGASLTR